MNYLKHYDLLIARARNRELSCYTERHHILPRCMGGKDGRENIVRLTPEEHYVAHQLLVKIYPENEGLIFAAIRQSSKSRGNKSYGWLRRKNSESRRRAQTGVFPSAETRAKLSAARKGKKRSMPFSDEWKAKIGAAHKGKKWRLGYKHTDEARQIMSALAMGKKNALGCKHPPVTVETRNRLSVALSGRLLSAEHKARIGAANKKRFLERVNAD